MEKQVGIVLVFNKGVTVEDVNIMIAQSGAMVDEIDYDASSRAQEFNPEWGGPVFYIP